MYFLITVSFLYSDYNTNDGDDLFADDGKNNSSNDFIPELNSYEDENIYDLFDNQEAYNASGNWSLHDNHSDTEMEEGNFKMHT